MRVGLAAVAVTLFGCNQVFDLTPIDHRDGAADDAPVDSSADIGTVDDRDGDGWRDKDDNCPDVANPSQHDDDDDRFGDACDRCPMIAEGSDGGDADNDGVGNSCDPHRDRFDCIVWFDSFTTDRRDAYAFSLTDTDRGAWVFDTTNGVLRQDNAGAGRGLLLTSALPLPSGEAFTHTTGRVLTALPVGTDAGVSIQAYEVGVWAGAEPLMSGTAAAPDGCVGAFVKDSAPTAGTSLSVISSSEASGMSALASQPASASLLPPPAPVPFTIALRNDLTGAQATGTLGGNPNTPAGSSNPCARGPRAGLRTTFVRAEFDYLFVTTACPGTARCVCPVRFTGG